jgi:transketolase
MFAAHHKIDNLIATVDLNGQQIDGPTEKVMSVHPLREKFEAFGWQVMEMNGNEMAEVLTTLDEAKAATGAGKPICILMTTVMGRGVPFMEGTHEWHGIAPSDEQLALAYEVLVETVGDY